MKIILTWTASGASLASNFVLADSPANVPMTNFHINGSRNIQEAEFYQAEARQFFDRLNRKTEVSFDTTRVFADQTTAESFILMHETQLPDGEDVAGVLVTFVAGSAGGTATVSRYLPSAVVQSVDSQLQGCTTKHSYRIAGGIMLAAKPN